MTKRPLIDRLIALEACAANDEAETHRDAMDAISSANYALRKAVRLWRWPTSAEKEAWDAAMIALKHLGYDQ